MIKEGLASGSTVRIVQEENQKGTLALGRHPGKNAGDTTDVEERGPSIKYHLGLAGVLSPCVNLCIVVDVIMMCCSLISFRDFTWLSKNIPKFKEKGVFIKNDDNSQRLIISLIYAIFCSFLCLNVIRAHSILYIMQY